MWTHQQNKTNKNENWDEENSTNRNMYIESTRTAHVSVRDQRKSIYELKDNNNNKQHNVIIEHLNHYVKLHIHAIPFRLVLFRCQPLYWRYQINHRYVSIFVRHIRWIQSINMKFDRFWNSYIIFWNNLFLRWRNESTFFNWILFYLFLKLDELIRSEFGSWISLCDLNQPF